MLGGLSYRTGFGRAAAREAEAISGKDHVAKIKQVRDYGPATQHHKRTEANRRVEPAKYFYPADPTSVRQTTMHLSHQLFVGLADLNGPERGSIDVGEPDLSATVPSPKQIDFPLAERTTAVKENLDVKGFFGIICQAIAPSPS